MLKKGLLALTACALAAPAMAATTDDPFVQDKAILRLDGLDLSTADGQQRLAIRMDQAARAVCGDGLANVHLALNERTRECRTAVLADIRTQLETRTAAAERTAPTLLASAR